MLDRSHITKKLHEHADKLFKDISTELSCAHHAWQKLIHDPLFTHKVNITNAPWLIPQWNQPLHTTTSYLDAPYRPYTVFAIDGSQIYPDHHQGTSCCLINIGSATFMYQPPKVFLSSEPHLYIPEASSEHEYQSIDFINCQRQKLEFAAGVTMAHHILQTHHTPPLFLFDGSLIFWHLEGKSQTLREEFIAYYITALHELYTHAVPVAGYISMPKSKELVNLVKLYLSDYTPAHNLGYKQVEHLVDSHIMQGFLKPFERTTIFASRSLITEHYPPHLKPHFFYLHADREIVRIEIPAWLAQNASLLEDSMRSIIDQINKGYGYPICIAEAHEQAVVKGPDRDFFYHMIQKIGSHARHTVLVSQKSIKKRGMGI